MSALIRSLVQPDGLDPEAPDGSAAGVHRRGEEPFGDLDLEVDS